MNKKESMKTDIRDRVKSYEDACREIGEEPIADFGNATPDEIAYKKLKTVIKALNEGWEPDWRNRNEYKHWPLFYVDYGANESLACAKTNNAASYLNAYISSLLCFKSRKLAEYAGKQFIDLYNELILIK
jgi:hypothetical protein